ncbi:MAG TPA: serine hydrolase domain-containing protein, partial [Enhygromyxa sp.]|nr:serine hydrolase domain-containing protein [Enhygromyxa sp.]
GRETPREAPVEREEAGPAPSEDPEAVRKRECVAALTAEAEPQVHALLRSLCAEWVELRVPGIAFAWARPGKPPVHAEVGVRCNGEEQLVEASSAFRIGSVSKPVTAALALGLIADGKLSRASEAMMVPGFVTPVGVASPQLGDLLRHRSGLGEIDPAMLVELDGSWLPALAGSITGGPAGRYQYSNAGYALVGAMLERASGQTYAQLVTTRISEPLGLARLSADVTIEDAACGHLVGDVEREPIAVREDLAFMPGDPSWMVPAGGLLSSATELASFALAIGSDALPGSAAMLEPGEPLPSELARAGHRDERYGDGLRSWQVDADTRMYGHTGNNAAFLAELRLVPGVGAIAILANCGVELPATMAAAEALLATQ